MASVIGGHLHAGQFSSDEVRDEAEVGGGGCIPVAADDECKNSAAVAILIKFVLYRAPLPHWSSCVH